MAVKTNNTDQLNSLLKDEGLAPDIANIMGQAIKEVTDEENIQKVKRCKDLVLKARELQSEMNAAERQFNGQKRKFDKQLGKLMKQINGMITGKPVEDEDADEEGGSEE